MSCSFCGVLSIFFNTLQVIVGVAQREERG